MKRILPAIIGIALSMAIVSGADAKRYQGKSEARSESSEESDSKSQRRKIRRAVSHNEGGGSASRSCLTSSARAALSRIEAKFGTVEVISTCRPGATIAGTGKRSKHASGEAIDFNAPSGKKSAIVNWLSSNHSGGVMTYRQHGHIHMDVGHHFVSLGAR